MLDYRYKVRRTTALVGYTLNREQVIELLHSELRLRIDNMDYDSIVNDIILELNTGILVVLANIEIQKCLFVDVWVS